MMAQQQQTLTEKAWGRLRRAISVLAMAVLIAVVLGIMAAPAFAAGGKGSHAIDTACSHSGGKAFSGGGPVKCP